VLSLSSDFGFAITLTWFASLFQVRVNRNEELNFAIRRGLWKRFCIAYLDHLSGVDNGLLASSEKQDLTSTSLRVL
jgi:hypothetical protein